MPPLPRANERTDRRPRHEARPPIGSAEPESDAAQHAAFLAKLAHDLRTPLNAMVGWLHLLTAPGGVSEDVRMRALAGLQRAVEQQRRVVAGLDAPLEFSDGYRDSVPDRTAHDAASGDAAAPAVRAPDADTLMPGPSTPFTTSSSAPSPSTLLEGVYVLAVDDDANVLQMLQSLLEHSGAIVESTTSPDEALRRYASWASGGGDRVVLSDLAMQERDGISLLLAVRKIECDRHMRRLPAIALSAHFRPDTRREAFEGGFDLFLAKPIDPFVLLNHLRNMLDR